MKTTTLKEQKVIFWRKHLDLANQYPDGIQKYCEAINQFINIPT